MLYNWFYRFLFIQVCQETRCTYLKYDDSKIKLAPDTRRFTCKTALSLHTLVQASFSFLVEISDFYLVYTDMHVLGARL